MKILTEAEFLKLKQERKRIRTTRPDFSGTMRSSHPTRFTGHDDGKRASLSVGDTNNGSD